MSNMKTKKKQDGGYITYLRILGWFYWDKCGFRLRPEVLLNKGRVTRDIMKGGRG